MIDGGIDQIRLSVIDLLRDRLAPADLPDVVFAGLSDEMNRSILNVLHSSKYARDGYPEEFSTYVHLHGEIAWGVRYTVTATATGGGDVNATIELIGLVFPDESLHPFPLDDPTMMRL